MAELGENFCNKAALTWQYNIKNSESWPSDWGLDAQAAKISYIFSFYGTATIEGTGYTYFKLYKWSRYTTTYSLGNIYIFLNSVGPNSGSGKYVAGENSNSYPVSKLEKIGGYSPSYPDGITEINARFKQYTDSDGNPLCIYANGRYYNIMLEQLQVSTVYSFHDKKGTTEYEPYQPFDDDSFGVTVRKSTCLASSASVNLYDSSIETLSGISAIEKAAIASGGRLSYPANGYATGDDSVTIAAFFGEDKYAVKWVITTLPWEYETGLITLTKKIGEVPFYAGVRITDEFAKCFSLSKTYSNDYKTVKEKVQDVLSLDGITIHTSGPGGDYGIYSEGDSLAFTYVYGNFSCDFNSSITKASVPAKGFCDGIVIDSFKHGDTVSNQSIADFISGKEIIYSNGSGVSLSDIAAGVSVTSAMGGVRYDEDESYVIDDGVTEIVFACNLTSAYLSSAKTDEISVPVTGETENYITSCEISGASESFKPGETIDAGEEAAVIFRNGNGDEVSRMPLSDAVVTSPKEYGSYPTESMRTDTIRELTFVVSPYGSRRMELKWRFTVDYYDEDKGIVIDSFTTANSIYYFSQGDTVSFNCSGMKAHIVLHENSEELGKTSSVEIDPSSFAYSGISLENATKMRNSGTAAFTLKIANQTLSGSLSISLIRKGIESIEAYGSDSTEYWDNGVDKFHYPTGVTLKYIYTDQDPVEQTIDDSLLFYRDSDLTQRLTESSAVSKASSLIYVVPSKTNAIGERISASYRISFKKDSILSVKTESAIKPCLGNKLSEVKEDAVLVANRESGCETTIPQSEWAFKTLEPILSECAIGVTVNGESFDLPSGCVEWRKPNAEISMSTASFPMTYMNKAESVSANKLSGKVVYSDPDTGKVCNYSEEISYITDESLLGKGKFTVSCSAVPDYVFDGASGNNISLDLSDTGTAKLELTVTSYDSINGRSITSSIAITVIEIYDITGISIRNPKTDYKVGESFLNDEDATIVRVFYKNAGGESKIFETYLRDEMTALNVYPSKGFKFSASQDSREITVSAASNFNVKASYEVTVGAREVSSETTVHDIVACKFSWGGLSERYFLVDSSSTKKENGKRVLADGIDMDELEVYGYLADLNDEGKNARIVLFDDYVAPIDGSNNITVRFPCYVEGNSDVVDKSHFGILFGNNNARNRLFISGNPDKPNMDWRSGECDSDDFIDESMADGNFAYFEDTSYATYGETDNAVVGYDIVANDKLLVLKGQSDKETTVYFRTPTTVTAINGSGTAVTDLDGNALYQEEFALSKGNNTVAGVSQKGMANFNGDSLFISSGKQLMGLDLTGIVGDNQRYANSRSYYIDEDLRREDFSDAFLWTDNEYLFIVLKDKTFVTHFEMKSDSQYEWWPLDLKNISSMLKVGDIIYFGTYDGGFFRFADSSYYDITKAFANVGDAKVTVDDGEERVIVSQATMDFIDDGCDYYFKVLSQQGVTDENSAIYYNWATANNSDVGTYDFLIDSTKDELRLVCKRKGTLDMDRMKSIQESLSESDEIYLMNLTKESDGIIEGNQSSPLRKAYGKPFRIRQKQTDTSDTVYEMVDSDGNVTRTSTLYRFVLCKKVKLARITNVSREKCTFGLEVDGTELDLIQYHSQPLANAFAAEIRKYEPVQAFMITKPYSMGKLDYLKTIWSVTITNDTNIPSEMEFCFVSNNNLNERMKTISKISKDALGYDLGKMNFESIDFEKNDVPRVYSRSRVISNVKFATFGFRNDGGTNCVLSSMSLTYTIPYHSYGD